MVPILSPQLSPSQLTQRPPTPPRESNRNETSNTLPSRRSVLRQQPLAQRVSTDSNPDLNPNLTPNSSLESPNTPNVRKKVEFSHLTEYQDSPTVSQDGRSLLGPLPPSAERKPTKSILKPFNHGILEQGQKGITGITKLLPPHHHADFATMLESICQQLAGGDRSDRIDAYLMLSGSLKASDNIPDLDALKDKMGLLQDFIQRDQSEKTDQGKLDSALAIHALQVLSSFLHKPAIARLLTADFGTYIVEHSINGFGDNLLPKDVVKNLLFVLAQQTFSSKVMTQERIGRLLIALHDLDHHVKGKSIVVGRISTYRALIRQSRGYMISNSIWLSDLFTDMLSSIREIRSQAISFGLEASFSLGLEDSASKAVHNLFKLVHKDGAKFAEYYAHRLHEMVGKKEESQQVPQIWSVIILFIRSKRGVFDQWPFMKPFLEVLQLCFNSSDAPTRLEANYAWNRFVYAVSPDEKTSSSMKKMLFQALVGQLKRPRKSVSGRKSTLSSIYNLLYYAFKPKASSTQIDLYWDEYLAPLVTKCLISSPNDSPKDDIQRELQRQDATDACKILQSLFDSTTRRTWTETRAMDNLSNTMDVSELPALDSKWLRKNSVRVSSLLSPLIDKLYWDLGEDSVVTRLWYSYIISIASPAAMEVKVSIDTMSSIATTFSSLYRIWNADKSTLGALSYCSAAAVSTAFLRSFEKLVSVLISGLGLLPFTEKLLSISHDTFIAVATPSQQPKKIRHQVRAPFHHLIMLLTSISPGLVYDQKFAQMVHRILFPLFQVKLTSKGQMKLVQDLLDLLPAAPNDATRLIWQVLAGFASSAVDMRDNKENNENAEQPLGVDYRNALRILEMGVNFSPSQPLPGWKTLFETLATSAILDAGEAGKAIAIIEPLAKGFTTRSPAVESSPVGLQYYNLLITKAIYPKDRQALDAARKRLWGTGTVGPKTATFDPYIHLYNYMQMTLDSGYVSCPKQNLSSYSDMISSTTGFVKSCPLSLLMGLLANIQESIARWIIDSELKVSGGNTLGQAITSLWSTVTKETLPQLVAIHTHTIVLANLEPLICSGFESKHKSIVNESITFWNTTFGHCEDGLEYPARSRETLLKIHSVADIQLPFFPESLETETPVQERQPLDLIDSQNDTTHYSGLSSISSIFAKNAAPHLMYSPQTRMRYYSPQVVIAGRSSSRKRSREATPDIGNRKSRKRDITPRIRHDDSQVQFEAIESSPMSDRIVDSQLLTDKQKEVRERQEADAAMFPDLRSSTTTKGKFVDKSPEPELPTHRSTSKLRITSSPMKPRQSTPTFVLPSDDDNFIASSPTPTRPIRQPTLPDPPSSPPESVVETPNRNYEAELPSLPAEDTPEPENDTTLSLDPSRQIDPYAAENNRPVSTFDTTSDHLESSPIDDEGPNSQLQAEEMEQRRLDQSLEIESSVQIAITRPQLPASTISDSVLALKPPGSTVEPSSEADPGYLDALTSPASSDKQNANEEVFEDAVSSPRLNIAKPPEQTSSPFSDLDVDESSILRLMNEFDQGSGQAKSNLSLEDKENQPCRTPDSFEKVPEIPPGEVLSTSNAPSSANTRSSPKQTQSLVLQAVQDDKNPKSSLQGSKRASSILSLIPETPGLQLNEDSTRYIIDGDEYDPADTIVVDTSVLEDARRPRFKRGSPRKRHALYSRKRKRQENVAEGSEAPESQESEIPGKEASLAREPTPKKRKGRGRLPKNLSLQSQSQSQSRESSQATPQEASGSNLSAMDFELTLAGEIEQGDENDGGTKGDAEKHMLEAPSVGELPSGNTGRSGAEPVEAPGTSGIVGQILLPNENVEMAPASLDQPDGQNSEDAANTTIDGSSFFDKSSFMEEKDDDLIEETVLGTSSEKAVTPPAFLPPDDYDANAEATVEGGTHPAVQEQQPEVPSPPVSILQSVKDTLSKVISDLRAAVLSKPEVNELEDMLFDAKRTLYDAELRGRQQGEPSGTP